MKYYIHKRLKSFEINKKKKKKKVLRIRELKNTLGTLFK